MLSRYVGDFREMMAGRSILATIGLAVALILTTGCASRSLDKSFDQLSASIDRFTQTVSVPDRPRDCGMPGRPSLLMLHVRFNGSCPDKVVPVENGCVDQNSRNVVCVCRNSVGTEEIAWQAVDNEGNPTDDYYELYFDPFKQGPTFKANGQGRIPNKKLINEPPVTSAGELIRFKYTVFTPDCDPRDPTIIIGQ
jgi:hypothetical protein